MIRRALIPCFVLSLGALALATPAQAQAVGCCALPDGTFEVIDTRICAERRGEEVPEAECTRVCCDDALDRRAERSLAACVGGGGAVVEQRPCLGCCAFDDGTTRRLDVGTCAEAGGAIGPNRLCEMACCAMPPDGPERVPPFQTLPAAQCAWIGGEVTSTAWCEDPLCCRYDAGGDFDTVASMEADECLGLSGTATNTELCVEQCCRLPGHPVRYATENTWTCRHLGGEWVEIDAELCAPVCCRLDDHAIETSAGTCAALDGEAVDAALCGLVCCDRNGTVSEVSPEQCADAGGVPTDSARCAPVCCQHADGTARPTLADACHGVVVPEAWCAPHCCRRPDGNMISAIGDGCPGDTEEVDIALCGGICCAVDGLFGTTALGACEASGGGEVEPWNCTETCCPLDDGSFAQMTVGACQVADGPQFAVPLDQCAQTCCLTPDGAAVETTLAECGLTLGGAPTDASACETICCREDRPTPRPRGDCLADAGVEVPFEACLDDRICCRFGATTVDDVPFDACLEAEGEVVPDARCARQCCHFGGEDFAFSTVGTCDDLGERPVDPIACAGLCCPAPGEPEPASFFIFRGGDGTCPDAQPPAPGEACLRCCEVSKSGEPGSTGQPTVLDAAQCAALEGDIVDDAACGRACCATNRGVQLLTEVACRAAGEPDPGRCGRVCCTESGTPSVEPAEACAEDAVDPEGCPVCCVRHGAGAVTPVAECETFVFPPPGDHDHPGELVIHEALPVESCEQICCDTRSGYRLVQRFECDGHEAPSTACADMNMIDPLPTDRSDDGGCRATTGAPPAAPPGWLLGLLAVLGLRRRRR